MNPPLPTSRPRPSVALYSSKMLRVRSPAPQEERSIREVAQGSVIICFTWSCLVEMRSEKWPEGTPTTVHVYDMEIEGDPAMHPVNGMQEFSQVYRGWYYRGPSRDGEPCAGVRVENIKTQGSGVCCVGVRTLGEKRWWETAADADEARL